MLRSELRLSCAPLQCARFASTGSPVPGKSGAGVRDAQSAPSLLPMRTMLVFACILAVAAAAPATYDQRQDGEFNVRADVQNVVFVVALPSKMTLPLLGLMKNANLNRESDLQERADIRVMEAFVEPSEPYHVEIGDSGRTADGDGRAVEVVIAGRRRLDSDPQPEAEQDEQNEFKLIGATEQCGPDRERDPDTLMCRARSSSAPAEAAPAPTPDSAPAQPQPQSQERPDVAPADHPSPEVVLDST